MSEKKETKFIKQSNAISKAAMNISSATAYRLIKYGTWILGSKYNNKENVKSLEEYRQMDLLDVKNWGLVDWKDFTCSFKFTEYLFDMGITEGGKQKKLCKKM